MGPGASVDISELPKAYESSMPEKFEAMQSYFELTLYVPPERERLVQLYRGAAIRHNAAVLPYLSGKDVACDSGFDLFVPEEQEVFPVQRNLGNDSLGRYGQGEGEGGAPAALAEELLELLASAPNCTIGGEKLPASYRLRFGKLLSYNRRQFRKLTDLMLSVPGVEALPNPAGQGPNLFQLQSGAGQAPQAQASAAAPAAAAPAPEALAAPAPSESGPKKQAVMINHHVKCCMRKIPGFAPIVAKTMDDSSTLLQPTIPGRLVGYYLYPRSSMATKTPLRLANSVGIIDAGYRGEIQAAVDVLSQDGFQLPSGLRIVQLCPPSLDSPIYVKVITDESLLGKTMRGAGGFGSTGRVGAKLDGDAGEGGDAGEQGDE